MKVGEGAGKFLGDLAMHVSDETMRKRWAEGHYGTGLLRPRIDYVQAWRKMAGRG